MKEVTLKKHLRAHLRRQYPVEKFRISSGALKKFPRYPSLDLYVQDKSTGEIKCIIECKGSTPSLYIALGQCLCYYWCCSVYPFYLAIPKDYTGVTEGKGWSLEDVGKIMARNGCKFGLISVSSDGKVTYEREPTTMTRTAP